MFGPRPLTFAVGAEREPVFAKHHVHPLSMPTHKQRPLGLPGVAPADPQDLLQAEAPPVKHSCHGWAWRVGTQLHTLTTTCIGWQMRLRVVGSPGLVLSGRRLSSSPSNIPLCSLAVLSLGPQLKKEWDLWRPEQPSAQHKQVFLLAREAPGAQLLTHGRPRCLTRRPG